MALICKRKICSGNVTNYIVASLAGVADCGREQRETRWIVCRYCIGLDRYYRQCHATQSNNVSKVMSGWQHMVLSSS